MTNEAISADHMRTTPSSAFGGQPDPIPTRTQPANGDGFGRNIAGNGGGNPNIARTAASSGHRAYNAKSRDDMRALAKALLSAPYKARPAMAANLMAEGLMLPRQWWVRLSIGFAKRVRGIDDFQAWANVCTHAPKVADELIEQTADWIVRGKDASGEGVGGFDQREVDAIIGMLLIVERRP